MGILQYLFNGLGLINLFSNPGGFSKKKKSTSQSLCFLVCRTRSAYGGRFGVDLQRVNKSFTTHWGRSVARCHKHPVPSHLSLLFQGYMLPSSSHLSLLLQDLFSIMMSQMVQWLLFFNLDGLFVVLMSAESMRARLFQTISGCCKVLISLTLEWISIGLFNLPIPFYFRCYHRIQYLNYEVATGLFFIQMVYQLFNASKFESPYNRVGKESDTGGFCLCQF